MKRIAVLCLLSLMAPAVCQAHFLWLVTKSTGDSEQVLAYFSESASPDDPELLKKFEGLKAVAVTTGRGGNQVQEIELKPTEDALAGALPDGVQAPLTAAQTYGVMSRGGESFLLKYYAKTYGTPLPGSWQAVNDEKLAALEITPKVEGDELVLTVTWLGKPVAGDQVTVEGDSLTEKIQGDTSADGIYRCKLPAKGLYSIRARHTEKADGELDGQKYASIRHYATLALPFVPQKIAASERKLADLPKGITSFGAAVLGDDLYVYGGHFGSPHHYSEEGQSNELRRLSLTKSDAAWEELPGGPRLTGPALEASNDKLYRLGGFAAKNIEADDQSLWSQDGFASFDPATEKWTDLPALPEPRSSHDADIVDGKLYVLGGWNMSGSDGTNWLETAWTCDLTQSELTWSALPAPPFKRRALSVTVHQGKLYAIGGMQDEGGPTTRVDVLDLATGTWSVGPSLIGPGMEGFGNASFTVVDRLVTSTISGSVQQLNADGTAWELIGQVHQPRFFHRQLTTPNQEFLVVGGASMATGKTPSVEVFTVKE